MGGVWLVDGWGVPANTSGLNAYAVVPTRALMRGGGLQMALRRGLPASAALLCATPDCVCCAAQHVRLRRGCDRSVARRLGAGTWRLGLFFVGMTWAM